MWSRWKGESFDHGPTPDFTTAKAHMAMMGMGGVSAHADDAFAELKAAEMWGVFEAFEGRGPLRRQCYQNSLKHFRRLGSPQLIVETTIKLVRELAELYPGRGIGERLLIDGTSAPAWCEQAPKGKSGDQEEYRRRLCPEAGARAIMQNSHSKKDLTG